MRKVTLSLSALDIQYISEDVQNLRAANNYINQGEERDRIASMVAFRQFVRDKVARLEKLNAHSSDKLPKNLASHFYKAESEANGLQHQINQLKKRAAQEGVYCFDLYVDGLLIKAHDACIGDDFHMHQHGYNAYKRACEEVEKIYPDYYSSLFAIINIALGAPKLDDNS